VKKLFRNIIRHTSLFFPYKQLQRANKLPPKIVLYHVIADTPPKYISAYGVKKVQKFKEDIDFLCKNYKPVSLAEITKQPDNNKLIHFTFDDGLKSCYHTIAPILKEKGIPATFFINPAFIDNNKIYHRFKYELAKLQFKSLPPEYADYKNSEELLSFAKSQNTDLEELAKKHNPYISHEELLSLKNDGFLIGGHSMDHPEFYKISFEEQYKQIEESMQWIRKHINPEFYAFAFPYTDHGIKNELLDKALKANLFDISLGTAGLKYDIHPKHFQRIPMEPKKLSSAKQIFKYEYFYFKLRKIVGKNTVMRP
jgi:peptidoglycan/xylan/chitin deacetylase (PgdA/CDA1 family)